jgi:hypothetical protein
MRGRPEGFSLATASPVQPLAVERVAATQSPGAGQWSSHPCAFTAPPAGGADIQSIEFHDDRGKPIKVWRFGPRKVENLKAERP